MTKVKAAMDQYVEGLQSLDVLDEVRKDPEKWKVFFVDNNVKVDASESQLKSRYLLNDVHVCKYSISQAGAGCGLL